MIFGSRELGLAHIASSAEEFVERTSFPATFASTRGELIYTGPVDEFFDFQFGELPYRSLRFEHETRDETQHQPVAVVNYPGAEPFTRITEFNISRDRFIGRRALYGSIRVQKRILTTR